MFYVSYSALHVLTSPPGRLHAVSSALQLAPVKPGQHGSKTRGGSCRGEEVWLIAVTDKHVREEHGLKHGECVLHEGKERRRSRRCVQAPRFCSSFTLRERLACVTCIHRGQTARQRCSSNRNELAALVEHARLSIHAHMYLCT